MQQRHRPVVGGPQQIQESRKVPSHVILCWQVKLLLRRLKINCVRMYRFMGTVDTKERVVRFVMIEYFPIDWSYFWLYCSLPLKWFSRHLKSKLRGRCWLTFNRPAPTLRVDTPAFQPRASSPTKNLSQAANAAVFVPRSQGTALIAFVHILIFQHSHLLRYQTLVFLPLNCQLQLRH